MPRYAAFLRGGMPTNCKMADLREAFEAAGFTDVTTLLSSGNVVFSAPVTATAALQLLQELSTGPAIKTYCHVSARTAVTNADAAGRI